MKTRKYATLFLLLTLITLPGYSQVPFFQHYYLQKKNDPVHINTIFQDREGFIWFGTNKGLFKFNGRSYQHFTRADSLPGNDVTAIAQDSTGRLWTGHRNGEMAYLAKGRMFRKFAPPEGPPAEAISDILFDRRGVMWFSTLNDGLYYYVNNRVHRLDDVEGMPDLYVYDILEDSTGNIWAGTDGGVAICTLLNDSVRIDVLDHSDGLKDDIIKKLVLGKDQSVWMGAEDGGVIQYHTQSREFSTLLPGEWKHGPVNDFALKGNKLWIASSQVGLVVVDGNTRQVKTYNSRTGYELPAVSTLLYDREGNIWAGTRAGVVRTPGDMLEFIDTPVPLGNPNVMALTVDQQGNTWFSTPEGLFMRKKTDALQSITTTRPLSGSRFANYRVISLYTDADNYVWAGLYGEGVLRIHAETGKIKHIGKEIRNGNVLSITGKKNTVWLATLGGSEKITIAGERLTMENYSRENGLSSDFIYQVFIDSRDRVWFATDGKGVDMLDEKGFHHLGGGLQSKVVYGFAEDKHQHIWINVQNEGIYRFHPQHEKFTPSTARHKLQFRDGNIQALASDAKGNIVLIHDQGIDVYEPEDETMRYLGDESGIQSRQANLNAVTRDLDGNLLFGTDGGIIQYNVQERGPFPSPKVVIDAFRVYGRKQDISKDLALDHDDNSVAIFFFGFWYSDPESVTFAYRMDNYDTEWIRSEDNNVTYSQLPPGEYTFRVRSFHPAAPQGSEETTFHFVIHPPFWRTPVFYGFSVIAFLAGAYAFIKYREQKLKRDKQELEKKVEERTREIQRKTEEIQAQNEEIMAQAEEIKGINENLEMLVYQRTAELQKKNKALEEYAFINAHKLRSPVASILGLVNLMKKTRLDEEAKAINAHLQQSADELDEIVRSITRAIERGEK